MANISLLSRLVNGVQRQVDLSTNTLVVQAIQINGTLLSSSGTTAGSTLVGDNNTYTNFTPGTATVKGALSAIDTALGSASSSSANKSLSNLTTTSINQNLIPGSDAVIALGAVGARWATLNVATVTNPASTLNIQSGNSTISFNNSNLTNVGNAVAATDAPNYGQVQALVNGLSWKQVVRSATTAALPTNTYSNGTAGVGATLTGTTNAALPAQDGVTLVVGDRLLVKNEAAPANNGIYTVTQVGSGAAPYILTRAADSNTATLLFNEALQVGAEASTQAGFGFRLSATSITVGTTALNYTNWSTGVGYSFGNGLTIAGSTVSVLANPTNASILVAAAGISVIVNAAGAIVAGASGLAIATDNTSISISANQLRIATGAYDQVTITGGNGVAAAVASAPTVKFAAVAGQAFSANTTYAVRFGLPQNSETAGRVYACDITTTSYDLFWCIGVIQPTSAVSIAGAVTVIAQGPVTNLSSDTAFGANDPGKALFLQSGGTQPTTTAPSTSGQAVAKLGIATSTTSWYVQIGAPYVA